MAKCFFYNILSSIFSQYNPTSLELSDEYYHACQIIKVFKYLCEAHNQYFQKHLMNEINYSITPSTKINFYDMMLFVIDKIIVISSWEKAKGNDEVQDYFYGLFNCIIELIIEIIQGSDKSNFKNFYYDEKEETSLPPLELEDHNQNKISIPIDNISNDTSTSKNKIFEGRKIEREKTVFNRRGARAYTKKRTRNFSDRYEKGKALKIFLNNIKTIMFDNTSESEIIFSVRKNLMDFLLSFMEESNCPRKIKNLIMSYYHPNIIIKSICSILKLYYLKNFNKTKENSINDENYKHLRINQIVEQNLAQGTISVSEKKPINKILKQLKFNEELCNIFLDLYFEDTAFSETHTFELCNVYYKYFILTYIQFKNEETIDFWNRVHNQTEETLSAYNKRSKLNNNLDASFGTINDESNFEAYYVIKLFKEISKHVLVKIKPEMPPIYVIYTVHPYSKYLSSDSKDEFLRKVDRTNRYSKLYDLITNSEYFKLEIIYNWNYLRKNAILRKSTEINYHMIGYISFIISLIFNFVLLCCLHDQGKSYSGENPIKIIDVFSYIMIIVVAIIVIFWFLTKYLLYFEIEKAKYKEDKNMNEKNLLTFVNKIKIN